MVMRIRYQFGTSPLIESGFSRECAAKYRCRGYQAVQHDNTLQVDSSNQLGVNISDVVETLQESVRYWSLANNFETSDYATKGMLYNTSNLRKLVTKIRVSWRNDDNYIAKLGLYRLDPDDGNRILEVLYFGGLHTENPGYDGAVIRFSDAPDGRIVIPAGIRLGIALSRNDNHANSLDIQHGFQNANSPDESYSDASVDFNFIGNTRLASVEPDTDDSLSPHNNEVWGNIKIFYTVAVSHASLIGDDNVNVDHISSGSGFGRTDNYCGWIGWLGMGRFSRWRWCR